MFLYIRIKSHTYYIQHIIHTYIHSYASRKYNMENKSGSYADTFKSYSLNVILLFGQAPSRLPESFTVTVIVHYIMHRSKVDRIQVIHTYIHIHIFNLKI